MALAESLDQCQILIGNLREHTCEDERSRMFSCSFIWMDKLCKCLVNICTEIQALICQHPEDQCRLWDTVQLSFSQIICCIRYYEKTMDQEIKTEANCKLSRHHFLERIEFCLTQIKTIVTSFSEIDHPIGKPVDVNFVTCMDMTLEFIEPYAQILAPDNNIVNFAAQEAEAIMDSVKIFSVVESLIAETMAFHNVALEGDRVALKALCLNVLRESIAFRDECNPTDGKRTSLQDRRLKASQLESALLKLEKLVNDSLLRLVLEVFVELRSNPLERVVEVNSHQFEKDKVVEEFDLLLDRISQIGIFAVAFSSSKKERIMLRSALASVESLNSNIIPFVWITNSHCVKLMECHWLEETGFLQRSIQKIIDTGAFSECLLELIDADLKQLTKKYDVKIVRRLADRTFVFVQHLQINKDEELKGKLSDDVKVMFKEVDECAKLEIAQDKIIKRVKILHSTIKKVHRKLIPVGSLVKEADENAVQVQEQFDDLISRCSRIEPSQSRILYGNSQLTFAQRTTNKAISTLVKKSAGRQSLRIAMFKNHVIIPETDNQDGENSIGISAILDQLVYLSSDF